VIKTVEVEQGRVKLPLPNYLQISKKPKYQEFYYNVNREMLIILKHTAFKSLKKYKDIISNYREQARGRMV
jgi:hypothetical protein